MTLNDASHTFEKGGTIFIPRNSWHGFSNLDHELLLLWMMSPPGLDGFQLRSNRFKFLLRPSLRELDYLLDMRTSNRIEIASIHVLKCTFLKS